MKLIIDIHEETYNDIQSRDWKNSELVFSEEWKAIHNGTPIPDNATNGDVVKAMFPNMKVDVSGGVVRADRYTQFDLSWWNASYQKGGKE